MLNEDYRDMLRALCDHEVRFLLVGAYATGAHGHPRATGDIDILLESTRENSRRACGALADFGAPVEAIGPDTFAEPGVVYEVGVAPRRIDLLTEIVGVDFDEAYRARTMSEENP